MISLDIYTYKVTYFRFHSDSSFMIKDRGKSNSFLAFNLLWACREQHEHSSNISTSITNTYINRNSNSSTSPLKKLENKFAKYVRKHRISVFNWRFPRWSNHSIKKNFNIKHSNELLGVVYGISSVGESWSTNRFPDRTRLNN